VRNGVTSGAGGAIVRVRQESWAAGRRGGGMASAIGLVLGHVPTILFVVAVALAATRRDGRPFAARLLDWVLLLPSGVGLLWAGLFNVALPGFTAAQIGWATSPFQFEIGVADLAIGLAAVLSFRRPLPYKAAVATYLTVFYVGVAIGHVRQAVLTGDVAPDNFGTLLLVTVVQAVLLPILLRAASRGTR
jgi:hypothetical protein